MIVNDKTKKQLLEELRELRSKKDFKEFIDKTSDLFFIFDKDLKYTYWNRASLRLIGIKAKEVLGKSILNIFPNNEQTQKAINAYKNVLKTKRPQKFINEYQIKGKDFIFEISVYPSQTGLIVSSRDITERKNTEERILQSEKELDALFKSVPVLLLLVDEERRVVKANGAALKFAQRTLREMIGARGGEALRCAHSTDDAKGCGFSHSCEICGVRNTVLDTFKTGKPHYHAEASLPFKIDGKEGVLNLLVNTVPVEFDKKKMVLVSIDNITEFKKAEEEIKNLSKIQKSLIENIPVLEYNVSPDGKILDCNKLTLKTLGYKNKDELIGKSLNTTIYAPSSREKAKKLFLKWKKQSWLKDEEIKIITKKGKILDVILNVNTLYDTNGKVLSTISTQLDISKRKKIEVELERTYNDLDRIFNTAADGMRVIDKNYNVLRVNEQFCLLSKLSKEENLKRKCYQAFPGPNCHKPTCTLKKILKGTNRVDVEEDRVTVDNKKIPCACTASPLMTTNGKVFGTVINYKDITERKKAEEEIKNIAKFPSENPNPVARIDFDGKILYGNEACKTKLREWKCRIGGDAPEPITNAIKNMIKEKSYKTQTIEASMGEKTFEFTVSPVKEADYINIYGRDITEKKKAEDSLVESKDRFKRLSEASKEGIIFHDNGVILDANQAAADIFGEKLSTLIGMNLFDLMTSESRKLSKMKVKMKYEGVYETQFNRHGKIIDIEVIGKQAQLDGREIRVAVFRDITDRKKAEEALLTKNYVFDESLWAKSIADNNGIIKECNNAFLRIYGYQNKIEVVDKPISSFIQDEKETITIITALDKSGKWEGHFTAIRKDGSTFYAQSLATTLHNKNDKLIGYQSSIMDVTELKEAEEEIKNSYQKIQKTLSDTINTLASIVEIRDPYTSGHQKNVALLATTIAEELGLDKDKIEATGTASLIHDIGKINIPPSILARPGKISDIEYSMIKTHPQVGYDMVKSIQFPWTIADIVLQHHERLDGSGYPRGLKGKDILLEARILAVADVVEAMASHRPYRPALGIDKALKEIKKGKGKLYDTKVVEACVKIIAKKEFKFLNG